MHWKSKSGQITVFSVIILLSVMILAGVLVDISRISAGRAIVRRAVDTAAKSVLAEYGSKLKEDYGIFALTTNDGSKLNDLFEEYLTCNLSIPGKEKYYKDKTDLFGFRIEKISVTPVFNLSENRVTKYQILEYMKYRAPTELVEGFVKKLAALKDLGRMSEAYRKKVSIDKILGRMDKSQQKLKKCIDGTGNPGDKFINGFNLGGSWVTAFNSFNSLSEKLNSIKSSIDSIDSSIEELEDQLAQEEKQDSGGGNSGGGGSGVNSDSDSSGGSNSGGGNSTDSSSGDGTGNAGNSADSARAAIDSLESERSSLQKECSDTIEQLKTVWSELRYSLTGDYIKANENALDEIKEIVEKGKQAEQAIADLEGYLEKNFGGEPGEFSTDFREQTQADLYKLKALILDGRKAEEMLKDIVSNSTLLKDIAGKLDSVGKTIDSAAASLPSELPDSIKSYLDISYDYAKPAKGDKEDDPRKGKTEAVKTFIIKKVLKDVNFTTEGISREDLPSCTKAATPDFKKEDAEFDDLSEAAGGAGKNGTQEAVYGGNLENVADEADLFDEESMFQENALEFISEIGNLASGKLTDLRDNIYLNEYIMGTFKNSVPELKQQNETIKDLNLHEKEKAGLDTFYDSEVEYILHGNPSQKVNNIMTRGELLLVRFGLDTLHVYTDAKKKAMATGIATAVAGWWTGGAGIPVISNLIMCGWGMGEALYDLTELMDGRSVPIYKMKGDWKLDIGLPASSGPKTGKRLYFNYHDYLRLFLLTMNEDKKLSRIEDLIQINIGKSKKGFKMSNCSTYIRVEAEVSMKYLFITLPFVQKELKTNDGRYKIKVLLYEGYQ